MAPKKTLYSVAEVAELLGVTRQEIVRRIWRGFITAEKVGRGYIITKREVEKLLKERSS